MFLLVIDFNLIPNLNYRVTYTCGEKVNQLKKKNFRGHNNAGFACQIGFSHNGQFVGN